MPGYDYSGGGEFTGAFTNSDGAAANAVAAGADTASVAADKKSMEREGFIDFHITHDGKMTPVEGQMRDPSAYEGKHVQH